VLVDDTATTGKAAPLPPSPAVVGLELPEKAPLLIEPLDLGEVMELESTPSLAMSSEMERELLCPLRPLLPVLGVTGEPSGDGRTL
jgi:hypothetical protein